MLKPIRRDFQVSFTYATLFTHNLFAIENPTLSDVIEGEKKRVLFVVDSEVARHNPHLNAAITRYCNHHHTKMHMASAPIVVPGGEQVKNTETHVDTLRKAVNDYGIDRHAYIVAIGGGAVLDMAGFAAATAHRGIRIIRVPTTVLAQNDAGVGVKNSINAFGKKNFLGTFAPPVAVINDFNFLETLEHRDWMAGVSEAIKVALLKDPAFFDYIHVHAEEIKQREMTPMEWLVYRCAELHTEHIATNGDPFEMGSSRPLDFGHWAAHKMEQLSNYAIRHGEAVAVGLALDVTYSYKLGMLPEADWRKVLLTFQKLGMAIYAEELDMVNEDGQRHVFAGLKEFQEHLGGQLTIMLLEGIGTGVEVHHIDLDVMAESIAMLKEWERTPQRGLPTAGAEKIFAG
ncbi:MAG: 3-dehydroquinate synthase, partial [Chloroflexota bacterium]